MRRRSSDPTRTPNARLPADARAVLTELYWVGVRAVAPGPAVLTAVGRSDTRFARRPWIIALGKAAYPMAAAAVDALAARGSVPAGGVIVAPSAHPAPHDALVCVAGDHPIPGTGSAAAADRLGEIATRVQSDDDVWLFLSGGASSLAAAPADGLAHEELRALYTLLLGSGLDIAAMNIIRKRFSRWGAGRLAAALHPARVRQFVISDVIGDDLAAISSGPCVGDPSTAAEVRASLVAAGLWDRTPAGLRRHLLAVERDPALETLKPGDPTLRRVDTDVIASNRIALEAIAAQAAHLGFTPRIAPSALAGEASTAGRQLAVSLASYCAPSETHLSGRGDFPCLIWGGETTVTLANIEASGEGGRCQELALAAALELSRVRPAGCAPWLLAAGTDGRDGATDAAGAIVNGASWHAVERAGRDPALDLKTHHAYGALDAAGALLRTGLTGTNVMDVVVGIAMP
jgi:glycerate-2-kinase